MMEEISVASGASAELEGVRSLRVLSFGPGAAWTFGSGRVLTMLVLETLRFAEPTKVKLTGAGGRATVVRYSSDAGDDLSPPAAAAPPVLDGSGYPIVTVNGTVPVSAPGLPWVLVTPKFTHVAPNPAVDALMGAGILDFTPYRRLRILVRCDLRSGSGQVGVGLAGFSPTDQPYGGASSINWHFGNYNPPSAGFVWLHALGEGLPEDATPTVSSGTGVLRGQRADFPERGQLYLDAPATTIDGLELSCWIYGLPL